MFPGFPEMSIILILVLVLFGAGKLSEVFASLGDGVKQFRSAQDGTDETDDTAARLKPGGRFPWRSMHRRRLAATAPARTGGPPGTGRDLAVHGDAGPSDVHDNKRIRQHSVIN